MGYTYGVAGLLCVNSGRKEMLDYKSFIAGVQVGRRIKVWDAYRKIDGPISDRAILTEYGEPILTEAGEILITEDGDNLG